MNQVHLEYPQWGSRKFFLKAPGIPWRKHKILP